jgi:hypothetical protein
LKEAEPKTFALLADIGESRPSRRNEQWNRAVASRVWLVLCLQLRMPVTTSPATSVSRKSRPANRYVSFL